MWAKRDQHEFNNLVLHTRSGCIYGCNENEAVSVNLEG